MSPNPGDITVTSSGFFPTLVGDQFKMATHVQSKNMATDLKTITPVFMYEGCENS